jgi:hypothetical protein
VTPVELAAVAAAVLIGAVAVFEFSLALGTPLGEATMGGRAPTVAGVLTPPFRITAAASGVVLLIGAWVVLARAGIVSPRFVGRDVIVWATWATVVFTALNTLSNLGGRHPLERWGFSAVTLAVTLLVGYVALNAP